MQINNCISPGHAENNEQIVHQLVIVKGVLVGGEGGCFSPFACSEGVGYRLPQGPSEVTAVELRRSVAFPFGEIS